MQSYRNNLERSSRRHTAKVSRYSESVHWPGHENVRPRSVSSSHLSSASRDYQANFHAKIPDSGLDSFDPYGGLNYRSTGMHLRSSPASQRQGERQATQKLMLAIAGILIVLIGAGMMWMNHSNNAVNTAHGSEIIAAPR